MTGGVTPARTPHPLISLRQYRALAPWDLGGLAALASRLLDASGIASANGAIRAHPTARTIRFYVAKGLVDPPHGRGGAATYAYAHLLQVLVVKLRQIEGESLDRLVLQLRRLTPETIERRVAAALGPTLPPPEELPPADGEGGSALPVAILHRIVIAPGVELLVDRQHPVVGMGSIPALADSIHRALAELVNDAAPPPRRGETR